MKSRCTRSPSEVSFLGNTFFFTLVAEGCIIFDFVGLAACIMDLGAIVINQLPVATEGEQRRGAPGNSKSAPFPFAYISTSSFPRLAQKDIHGEKLSFLSIR